MATRNMTKSLENKGWKAIIAETHTLNQVLKAFSGLCSKKLEGLDGLTVGQFLALYGISTKGGKVTASNLRTAWHEGLFVPVFDTKVNKEVNKMGIFRAIKGTFTPTEGHELYAGKDTRHYFVATKAEAEKYVKAGECEFISQYKIVAVPDDRWDTALVAKGMKQTREFAKHNQRGVDSALVWEEVAEAYIVYELVKADGTTERHMLAVDKDQVKF